MKPDNERQDKCLGVFVPAAIAVTAVLVLLKAGSWLLMSASAGEVIEGARSSCKADPNRTAACLAASKQMAADLKKKNLFVVRQPPGPVSGILGSEALIMGRWCKAGDEVQGAKVISVGPTSVTIEWEGKEMTLAPIAAAGPGADGARSMMGRGARVGMSPARPSVGGMRQEQRPEQRRPGERFRNLSDEQRTRMRERFQNMSEEERERFRSQMRERAASDIERPRE